MTDPQRKLPENDRERLAAVGAATLGVLALLEAAQRRLHPPALPELVSGLAPARDRLGTALDAYRACPSPEGLEAFHARLVGGASAALDAVTGFCDPGASGDPTVGILKSFRTLCRSLEMLYPLRTALPPLARHFVEPAFHGELGPLDPEPPTGESVGLHHAGGSGDPDARDGFTLYVPERYDGADAWPLVVALHGGYGHGRDFVWSWLREARGRGFLLLAPTSHGTTWSLLASAFAPNLNRVLIDANAFDHRSEAAWLEHFNAPGILRVGGLDTAALCTTAQNLLLHNTAYRFQVGRIQQGRQIQAQQAQGAHQEIIAWLTAR